MRPAFEYWQDGEVRVFDDDLLTFSFSPDAGWQKPGYSDQFRHRGEFIKNVTASSCQMIKQ
jgi:hypothetical protein